MILDSLDNLGRYSPLNPRFGHVCQWLQSVDPAALPDGRYEIDGADIFATIGESTLRPAADAPLEAHDRYIDIQILLRGKEAQGWRPRSDCRYPSGPLDPERDIIFFGDAPASIVELHEGQMTLFFPADAHAPLIGEGTVRKCVVKVGI